MPSESLNTAQMRILAGLPQGSPVVMLNLLRFRAEAQYGDQDEHGGSAEPCSGPEAYERYSRLARPALAHVGASVVFMGQPAESLIGPGDERWDLMLLVRYPSPEAFRSMVSAPDYLAALRHRTAAVEDSRLTPLLPLMRPTGQG